MNQSSKHFYDFGPFRLDEAERRLLRDGEEVVIRENGKDERLTAKAFDLLLALVKQRGHMIERDKLLGQLWPGTYVEDNRLSDNISTLRKFLGDRAKNSSYIETVPKHGYRFVAEVREVGDEMVALVEQTRTRIVIEEEGDESAKNAVPVLRHLPHNVEPALAAANAAVPPSGLGRRRTAFTLLLLALVIGGGGWLFVQLRATTPARAFEKVRFVRLTAGGRLGNARITGGVSISPNGKYVVLWTEESGLHSLWVRQVATSSTQRIFGPADGIFGGTTFSPDGAFVYFSGLSEAQPANVLYRVPVLGGVQATVSTGVDSPITFSPDGKQSAFVRLDEGQGASSLIVADTQKGTERVLVTRRIPDQFASSGPAWSPDGKLIACGGWTLMGDTYSTVLVVPAEGGPVRPVTSQRWSVVFRVAWVPDGSGLIVAAAEQGYGGDFARTQIWHVSYPQGEARRITNDLNGYGQVSLDVAADARTIVTVQEDSSSQIWLAPLANPAIGIAKKDGGAGPATQISHGKYDGLYGFAWMPDGKIVYLTQADHNIDIWRMNADGSAAMQLSSDAHFEYFPSVSPDGRYILFSSNRAGNWNIWRMDADSQNARQLTTGIAADNAPICSPDGRWVVFNSFRAGKQTIWKVPIDGGEPTLITDQHAALPAISPDGKWIGYSYSDEVSSRRQKLAIIPFEGGRPVRVFDLPVSFALRSGFAWTSDGEAVLYVNNPGGVGNIWAQPIKGGAPAQLTYFTTRPISRFALSPDGKQIAVSYQSVSDDVVLIRDLR